MTQDSEEPRVEQVTLAECPPGPFWFGDTLGFKTEYGAHNGIEMTDHPDAYVAESGEFFWGGAKTHDERSALMVEPIAPDTLARHRLQSQTVVAGDGLWTPASEEQRKLGWTYALEDIERVRDAARESCGYDATLEFAERVMEEADRRFALATPPSPHPIASASEDTAGAVERARANEAIRALEIIRGYTDADEPTSYRADDREGCLDAVYVEADRALAYIAALPASEHGRDREAAFVAGPIWREQEEEDECWTAEIQVTGGHYVVATVHGGSRAEAEMRQSVVLAALQPQSGEAGA